MNSFWQVTSTCCCTSNFRLFLLSISLNILPSLSFLTDPISYNVTSIAKTRQPSSYTPKIRENVSCNRTIRYAQPSFDDWFDFYIWLEVSFVFIVVSSCHFALGEGKDQPSLCFKTVSIFLNSLRPSLNSNINISLNIFIIGIQNTIKNTWEK